MPKLYWTEEKCFEAALRCSTVTEFYNNYLGAYKFAKRHGLLEDYTWFKKIERNPIGYWTKERVFEESKKYQSRTEFSKNAYQAYDLSVRNNWLNEMSWLIPTMNPKGYWTKERVFEESKKCHTRKEFQINCGYGYQIARINGWLDEMPWLVHKIYLAGQKKVYLMSLRSITQDMNFN